MALELKDTQCGVIGNSCRSELECQPKEKSVERGLLRIGAKGLKSV
jgi:hypothetical protein